jgi:hypothetical protein
MADSQEEKARREAEEIFKNNAVTPPARSVDIPAAGAGKSLSEVEDDGGQASDLVATLRRLFPSFPEIQLDRIFKAIPFGRILHDTMLDRINLTVTAIVEGWDDREIEDGGDD